jgi:hypothetical protein
MRNRLRPRLKENEAAGRWQASSSKVGTPDHSLKLLLLVTGLCWVGLYFHAELESKMGAGCRQPLSAWTQILALVIK